MSYHPEIERLLIDIRYEFHKINADDQLTEGDKKQLKNFYLQHMVAPQTRKPLQKYFPENSKFPKPRVRLPPAALPRPSSHDLFAGGENLFGCFIGLINTFNS